MAGVTAEGSDGLTLHFLDWSVFAQAPNDVDADAELTSSKTAFFFLFFCLAAKNKTCLTGRKPTRRYFKLMQLSFR